MVAIAPPARPPMVRKSINQLAYDAFFKLFHNDGLLFFVRTDMQNAELKRKLSRPLILYAAQRVKLVEVSLWELPLFELLAYLQEDVIVKKL